MKSLKDIEKRFIDFKNNYDYSLDEEAVFVSDLKHEAMKWIKELHEQLPEDPTERKTALAQIAWIVMFFDLEVKE